MAGEVLCPVKPLGQCAAALFGALLRPQDAGGGGISHLNLLVLDLAAEVEVVGNFHVGRLPVGIREGIEVVSVAAVVEMLVDGFGIGEYALHPGLNLQPFVAPSCSYSVVVLRIYEGQVGLHVGGGEAIIGVGVEVLVVIHCGQRGRHVVVVGVVWPGDGVMLVSHASIEPQSVLQQAYGGIHTCGDVVEIAVGGVGMDEFVALGRVFVKLSVVVMYVTDVRTQLEMIEIETVRQARDGEYGRFQVVVSAQHLVGVDLLLGRVEGAHPRTERTNVEKQR